ncbi:hypothetical protein GQ54DRAFT_341739 [Martensiomyces pterosporus]|nr:hypothetical protein GQ54DRAFT_341739 [Martensiomyces pterosporus]
MALLDELPLEILLAVVQLLKQKLWYEHEFCKLLPVASVSTSLRGSLLPLLYRDLVFEFTGYGDATFHNVALANSAGCSEYVQRVKIVVNEYTAPDDIVRVVRDDMDAGNQTKWPNMRSYAYIYEGECRGTRGSHSCSDITRQLDKELPKLRQAYPITCKVASNTTPRAYNPPLVSFLTQLTSLRLSCTNQGIDTDRLPQFFAPTLVDLTLYGAKQENIWNIFYDGQENQTVVFARLRHLDVIIYNPRDGIHRDDLLPHLQGATDDTLAERSVWVAGAASGKPGCRVPLFPVLRTLSCWNMTYDFHDFISRTQCHNSLVSLNSQLWR